MQSDKKVVVVKMHDKEIKTDNRFNMTDSAFWFCGAILIVFLTFNCAREIRRPFYGLHSWGQASGAWGARVRAKYGFGYTKGISTWAVGNPPRENPDRYYDHPQLGGIINGLVAKIGGYKEYVFRVVNLVKNMIIMLLFLRILKGLTDNVTTLLAAVIYAMFPITAYFTMGGWTVVLGLGAIYFYLIIIGALRDGPTPGKRHKVGLAACLFLGLQIAWTGFFYAFAIGLHYVCRCLKRKQLPDWPLITIMVVAPFASLSVTFTIMAAGYGWDVQKIIDLYLWRAGNAEVAAASAPFDWGMWFDKLWEFSLTNYTLPIVFAALAYITIGQLLVFSGPKDKTSGRFKFQFPQFWLFITVPVSQLFALKGSLWRHQTWLHPFDFFVAISAALAVILIFDIIKKVNVKVAVAAAVAIVAIFTGFCIAGTNYYYDIRWQPEQKIDMFKILNQQIPPDKYLLSFEDFIVNQHPSKGGFYRPEIAWYLDREITQAQTLPDIEKYAATGQYPYYLIPNLPQLRQLISPLMQRYSYQFIPSAQGKKTKDGKFLRAGMYPYLIFDLKSKKGG